MGSEKSIFIFWFDRGNQGSTELLLSVRRDTDHTNTNMHVIFLQAYIAFTNIATVETFDIMPDILTQRFAPL